MKTKVSILAALALGIVTSSKARTTDVAFAYRMGAGFEGEVNRGALNSSVIEPALIDTTNPPLFYGCAVLVNTASNGVRNILASDSAITTIYGVAVRPYPTQQAQSSNNFATISLSASVAPPTSGVIDVIREGYVFAKCRAGTPTKKGPVYVWFAASSGNHVQGGFEATATGGSTATLTNAWWNGPADANGIAEMFIAVAN